jgi:hypothetical protein
VEPDLPAGSVYGSIWSWRDAVPVVAPAGSRPGSGPAVQLDSSPTDPARTPAGMSVAGNALQRLQRQGVRHGVHGLSTAPQSEVEGRLIGASG